MNTEELRQLKDNILMKIISAGESNKIDNSKIQSIMYDYKEIISSEDDNIETICKNLRQFEKDNIVFLN